MYFNFIFLSKKTLSISLLFFPKSFLHFNFFATLMYRGFWIGLATDDFWGQIFFVIFWVLLSFFEKFKVELILSLTYIPTSLHFFREQTVFKKRYICNWEWLIIWFSFKQVFFLHIVLLQNNLKFKITIWIFYVAMQFEFKIPIGFRIPLRAPIW